VYVVTKVEEKKNNNYSLKLKTLTATIGFNNIFFSLLLSDLFLNSLHHCFDEPAVPWFPFCSVVLV